jgi:hypothetical protein
MLLHAFSGMSAGGLFYCLLRVRSFLQRAMSSVVWRRWRVTISISVSVYMSLLPGDCSVELHHQASYSEVLLWHSTRFEPGTCCSSELCEMFFFFWLVTGFHEFLMSDKSCDTWVPKRISSDVKPPRCFWQDTRSHMVR